ncbi:zinc finger protein 501-like [Eupeodes corollae]|uniref:zinc finger protein 501-like n=1 Tax=Eupeodes corollae TaxID=290404 RepID=UPI002490B306|nr:zinc finger protein 501-like [Eupeodes corollae]
MTSFHSEIILKNEYFPYEENNPNYANPEETKCGQVILVANCKFCFVCTFCDARFQSVVMFRSHILGQHVDAETFCSKDDPLDIETDDEEIEIKSSSDVTENDCKNLLNDLTGNNTFISTQKCDEAENCSDNETVAIKSNPDPEIIEIKCNNLVTSNSFYIPKDKGNYSDFKTDQHNFETRTDKAKTPTINDLGSTEVIQFDDDNLSAKEDSKNVTLYCKDIEDLLSPPKKVSIKSKRKKKAQECSICEHIAQNKRLLQAHMTREHGTGTQYQCEECGKCFRNASNLKSHLVIHSGNRPYKCEFCNSGFSHPNSLRTHRYIHTGERPHKCNQCDKGFVSSTGLKIHIREHTGEKPFVCQFCKIAFANKYHYNRHIISHSNRRPFECSLCDKAFKHRETYNKHMVCHTNEKNEVCDYCQKRFFHKKNLLQHKKIHSNVKQYSCKICKKHFAQNAGLYSHMKLHKNKE